MTHINTTPGSAERAGSNWTTLETPPDGDQQTLPGLPLEIRHVRQLANAEAFAAAQGHPLTAHITIHLRLAEGFREDGWPAFQTRLLDKASRWLKRRGLPVAFAWVRENGPIKGPHLHLMAHVPHAQWGAFKIALLRAGNFAVSDSGGEAIVIRGGCFGALVPSMRAGILRYLAKSLEASNATRDALGIRHKPTLPVMVQRCGVSHSISQQVRSAAGWRELVTFPELRDHLHPPSAANDNSAEADHAAA